MVRYTPIVPNAFSASPQMMQGGSLDLAGGGFSLNKAIKTAGLAANVAMPLVKAYYGEGIEGGAMESDDESLDGEGFGRGTQRKVMNYGKKGAKLAEGLVQQFGTDEQRRHAATARKVADTISGEGFGRGTQRKIMKYGQQGAKVGEKLIHTFGTDEQKSKATTARKVADTISGSGGPARATKPAPAAALRAMIRHGQSHI